MRRENFERVKEIMLEISDREELVREINAANQYTPLRVAIGKYKDVHLPDRFEENVQRMVREVLIQINAEIHTLTMELESL